MHIGFAIGWLIGLYAGNIYCEYFQSGFFSETLALSQWGLIPYHFVRNGAILGSIAGVVMIPIVNSRLLNKRVIALYENKVNNPKDIARNLGKSER